MESAFDSLVRNFSKHSWSESSLEFSEPTTSMVWNPQSDFTYVGDIKGTMQSVDMIGPFPVPCDTMTIASSRITDIAVNPSGSLFALSSADESYIVVGNCDPSSGSLSTTAQLSSTSHPLCVSFMEDHRSRQNLILIGSRQGIRIIDSESGILFREMKSKGGATTSLHTWKGCMVASGNSKGGVSLWDARAHEPISHFSAKNESGRAVFAIDELAQVLVLAGVDGIVHLFDVRQRKEILKKTICDNDVKVLQFSPSRRFLLAADKERRNKF